MLGILENSTGKKDLPVWKFILPVMLKIREHTVFFKTSFTCFGVACKIHPRSCQLYPQTVLNVDWTEKFNTLSHWNPCLIAIVIWRGGGEKNWLLGLRFFPKNITFSYISIETLYIVEKRQGIDLIAQKGRSLSFFLWINTEICNIFSHWGRWRNF